MDFEDDKYAPIGQSEGLDRFIRDKIREDIAAGGDWGTGAGPGDLAQAYQQGYQHLRRLEKEGHPNVDATSEYANFLKSKGWNKVLTPKQLWEMSGRLSGLGMVGADARAVTQTQQLTDIKAGFARYGVPVGTSVAGTLAGGPLGGVALGALGSGLGELLARWTEESADRPVQNSLSMSLLDLGGSALVRRATGRPAPPVATITPEEQYSEEGPPVYKNVLQDFGAAVDAMAFDLVGSGIGEAVAGVGRYAKGWALRKLLLSNNPQYYKYPKGFDNPIGRRLYNIFSTPSIEELDPTARSLAELAKQGGPVGATGADIFALDLAPDEKILAKTMRTIISDDAAKAERQIAKDQITRNYYEAFRADIESGNVFTLDYKPGESTVRGKGAKEKIQPDLRGLRGFSYEKNSPPLTAYYIGAQHDAGLRGALRDYYRNLYDIFRVEQIVPRAGEEVDLRPFIDVMRAGSEQEGFRDVSRKFISTTLANTKRALVEVRNMYQEAPFRYSGPQLAEKTKGDFPNVIANMTDGEFDAYITRLAALEQYGNQAFTTKLSSLYWARQNINEDFAKGTAQQKVARKAFNDNIMGELRERVGTEGIAQLETADMRFRRFETLMNKGATGALIKNAADSPGQFVDYMFGKGGIPSKSGDFAAKYYGLKKIFNEAEMAPIEDAGIFGGRNMQSIIPDGMSGAEAFETYVRNPMKMGIFYNAMDPSTGQVSARKLVSSLGDLNDIGLVRDLYGENADNMLNFVKALDRMEQIDGRSRLSYEIMSGTMRWRLALVGAGAVGGGVGYSSGGASGAAAGAAAGVAVISIPGPMLLSMAKNPKMLKLLTEGVEASSKASGFQLTRQVAQTSGQLSALMSQQSGIVKKTLSNAEIDAAARAATYYDTQVQEQRMRIAQMQQMRQAGFGGMQVAPGRGQGLQRQIPSSQYNPQTGPYYGGM